MLKFSYDARVSPTLFGYTGAVISLYQRSSVARAQHRI